MTQPRTVQFSPEELDQINEAADKIMLIDGDSDHMNRSNLTCEQTQSVARFLRALAWDRIA